MYISFFFFGVGLFPEISWLSLIISPVVLMVSPLIIAATAFLSALLSVVGSLAGVWSLFFIVSFSYIFMVFMAVFGEVILIPWLFLSVFPIGVGITLLYISTIT